MTARKPRNVDWQTWIDQQIAEGHARGEFDDLPGYGKPIEGLDRPHDELWWVRDWLKREGVEYLPPALAIRKKAAEDIDKAMHARSEQEARTILDALNDEIRTLNRTTVDGPPTTLMPFDVDELLERRRRSMPPPPPPTAPSEQTPVATEPPRPPGLAARLREWLH